MTPPTLNVRKTERLISWMVIFCLAVIACGVLLRQSHLNPAVLLAHELGASGAARAAAAAMEPSWLPPTLREFGAAESFTSDNLYDKINGKAELYVAAGFSRMDCQRFALKESPDEWFEWFCYGMNGKPQAFSVFSTQRRPEGKSLGLAPDAYRTRNALFFVSGTNYIEAIGSTESQVLLHAMEEMAQRYVSANQAEGGGLSEKEIFPAENLVPGSISLQTSDAFGFDRFKNVFTARYSANGLEMMAFVISCPAPEAAADLSRSYRAFLLENGGREVDPGRIELGKPIEILGSFEVVFAHGNHVAGIHAAPTAAAAAELGKVMHTRLLETTK